MFGFDGGDGRLHRFFLPNVATEKTNAPTVVVDLDGGGLQLVDAAPDARAAAGDDDHAVGEQAAREDGCVFSVHAGSG